MKKCVGVIIFSIISHLVAMEETTGGISQHTSVQFEWQERDHSQEIARLEKEKEVVKKEINEASVKEKQSWDFINQRLKKLNQVDNAIMMHKREQKKIKNERSRFSNID